MSVSIRVSSDYCRDTDHNSDEELRCFYNSSEYGGAPRERDNDPISEMMGPNNH